MFHFIYETQNIINGKIYRGAHSTVDLNDEYLGSGKRLKRAIKKYGRENFKRIILEFCPDSISMFIAELKWITDEFIKRQDVYNMIAGGRGGHHGSGNPMYGRNHSIETRQKIASKRLGKTFKIIKDRHGTNSPRAKHYEIHDLQTCTRTIIKCLKTWSDENGVLYTTAKACLKRGTVTLQRYRIAYANVSL